MGTTHTTMKVLITLCAAVAAVSAAPRYLVIPIEDVDMSVFSGQTLPVYRVPGLARTARMAQEEDSYQSAPAPYDSQGSSSDSLPLTAGTVCFACRYTISSLSTSSV